MSERPSGGSAPAQGDLWPSVSAPAASRAFEGYPYLAVEVLPSMKHLSVLPSDLPTAILFWLASAQAEANRFPCTLVLRAERSIRFDSAGRVEVASAPPAGNLLVCDRLRLAAEFEPKTELVERRNALRRFVDELRLSGYLVSDKRWLGRRATEAGLTIFSGRQACGVPNGLKRCSTCGEWRGRCLDPNPLYAGLIMPVHCRCQNDTRCAGCGRPLADRRLNALRYDPSDGQLWCWPGFMAFSHTCEE